MEFWQNTKSFLSSLTFVLKSVHQWSLFVWAVSISINVGLALASQKHKFMLMIKVQSWDTIIVSNKLCLDGLSKVSNVPKLGFSLIANIESYGQKILIVSQPNKSRLLDAFMAWSNLGR